MKFSANVGLVENAGLENGGLENGVKILKMSFSINLDGRACIQLARPK